MKRKDLTLIIMVALVAAVFSYLLSNVVFSTYKSNPVKVPVVQPISSNFPMVNADPTYKDVFNINSIDPTQLIRIGGQVNTQPFTGQ